MTTTSSIQLRRSTTTNSTNTQALVISSTTVTANDGLIKDNNKYKKFIEQRECEEFLQKLKEFHKLKW
jgi:hypothetical protein